MSAHKHAKQPLAPPQQHTVVINDAPVTACSGSAFSTGSSRLRACAADSTAACGRRSKRCGSGVHLMTCAIGKGAAQPLQLTSHLQNGTPNSRPDAATHVQTACDLVAPLPPLRRAQCLGVCRPQRTAGQVHRQADQRPAGQAGDDR